MEQNQESPKQLSWIRYIWLMIAGISFAVGTIGIVLPLLPTVPFYMLTVFALTRGSERFHKKFIESSLYQKTVGAYEKDKSMTMRSKLTILSSVTVLMGIGAYFSCHIPIALVILALVWVGHVIGLFFFVKTKRGEVDET